MTKRYSVIVVGGGHAGCEAALASARMGVDTLLITMKKDAIGYTSCNPAIGGIGKGQLVKEVDALGGEMARAADKSCIQYRMLNRSKGYAARSSRMQIDRQRYNDHMSDKIFSQNCLDVIEDEAVSVMSSGGECRGITGASGTCYTAACVVITAGTYMNGTMHIGLEQFPGGRMGESPSKGLSESLASLGFRMGKLKTGTPARLDGRTINFDGLESQPGDHPVIPFSFSTLSVGLPQLECYITRTSSRTHSIIRSSLDRSPLYSGKIRARGVRYCPAIEDKVVRFPERDSHLVFLEPEGLNTRDFYPNGVSTSLPVDVQKDMYRSIRGLEKVEMVKPAYGIEYDYADPTQLSHALEAKHISGLFLAGQVNGTTGYEEAASLGLMAGINAARKARGESQVVLNRPRAYIGVLIDDLVTKGTTEPYRMFTSRVEYRILVREDNAPERLSDLGFDLGLVDRVTVERVRAKQEKVLRARAALESVKVSAAGSMPEFLREREISLGEGGVSLANVLRRPDISYDDIARACPGLEELSYYEKVSLEVDIKYTGYIEREKARIKKMASLDRITIPEGFDYLSVQGLSNEIREKLDKVRPVSLSQAARISGVTPAAISILMVRLSSDSAGKRGAAI